MSLHPFSELRSVYDITEEEKNKIYYFLQGAVYCWCKNRPNEWFSMRELMGGANYFWQETPLFVLYEKHIAKGKEEDEAIEGAAKDSGWLLKQVISQDKREFETKVENLTRNYRWRNPI